MTDDDQQRQLAWELHVELATRVTTVPLEPGTGRLREALDSLASVARSTTELLRVHGDEATAAVERAAQRVLSTLHPFVDRWDRELTQHEANRPPSVDPVSHERVWASAGGFHAELARLQAELREIAGRLAEIAGSGSLRSIGARSRGRT